eukprot:5169-Heterococcus_DN1.PRE.11
MTPFSTSALRAKDWKPPPFIFFAFLESAIAPATSALHCTERSPTQSRVTRPKTGLSGVSAAAGTCSHCLPLPYGAAMAAMHMLASVYCSKPPSRQTSAD